MKKLALLVSLLALGALGLVACGGGDDDEATAAPETETTRDRTTRDQLAADLEADPASKSCGGFRLGGQYPLLKVEVVEGDVPCRLARRVMKDFYHGRVDDLVASEPYVGPIALVGSWRCRGPESFVVCMRRPGAPSGRTIRAHFPEAKGGLTPDLTQTPPPELTQATTPPEEIARIGDRWAPNFAAADPAVSTAACGYMTAVAACERTVCESVGGRPMKNCTPLPSGFRKSFTRATVRDVAVRGDQAAAKFSNGEAVKLELDGTGWLISKIGGNAGEFYREVALGAKPASNFCGGFWDGGHYGLIKVEVVEGNVPCRVAQRVLKRQYRMGLPTATGSWSCYGPEGLIECYKKPGKTIRAHFPDNPNESG